MSVCIMGSGLAGLATAVKLKINNSNLDVCVVTNGKTSNTVMAGQRFRPRITSDDDSEIEKFVNLMAYRNFSNATPEMQEFSECGLQELKFWTNIAPGNLGVSELPRIEWNELSSWFGPQLGKPNNAGFGRGRNLVSWFNAFAENLGVKFIHGSVTQLNNQGTNISSITVENKANVSTLHADTYVLAAGSIGGSIFNSTNIPFVFSSQELAYKADILLSGATLNMFHIFGNAKADGAPKAGCYETDLLDSSQIYLFNNDTGKYDILDEETTDLLSSHQSHYHFNEISRRFLDHGGIVNIVTPGIKDRFARVSHHYSHLGVCTENGVRVKNSDNLFAVGDAVTTSHWSGHQIRYPGVALTNCLVTAYKTAQEISETNIFLNPIKIAIQKNKTSLCPTLKRNATNDFKRLKNINTAHLFELEFSTGYNYDTASRWINKLGTLFSGHTHFQNLVDISKDIAACYQHREEFSQQEPIYLKRGCDYGY